MSTGRHRLPTRTRAALTSPLGITALVVGLITVLSLAVPLGLRYAQCAETRYLRVAASLSIASVVQKAADEFNEGDQEYSGACVFAQASEIGPHLVTTRLSGGPGSDSAVTPDVWVPESSAWVELTRISETGAQNIETSPRSLASSPVVLAAPRGAEGLPRPEKASWELVLPDERGDRGLVMVDPNRGTPGMAAMYAVRRELGTGDRADKAMTDFVRDVQRDTAFSEVDLSAAYPAPPGTAPLTVVPEQEVLRYNSTGSGARLEALYPAEGTVLLDYPFVAASDDPRMRSAADDLFEILRSAPYRERLRTLGFREPDGSASAALEGKDGIIAAVPKTRGGLTGDALLGAVNDWNRLSMPTRALVLADVSESMATDLDGGPSRLEVTKDAARFGLSLFPDETDLGLWLLSTEFGEQGRDEVEGLAQLGRADDDEGAGPTRREELQGIAEDIGVEGGRSRLYDNILAAYREMQDAYAEDKINSIILLTAGSDNGSSDISADELVAELQDRFDPDRPVTMFIIAFGSQSEREELQRIANATSGTLHVTNDAAEIGDIFLGSVSRRLCVPDCDE